MTAETNRASDRIRLFLEEQASLGRDGRYEIWADKRRPQHVITLGDLRALVAPPAVTHRTEPEVPTPGECRPGWHSIRYLTAEQAAEEGFPADTWSVCLVCGHQWRGAAS